MTIHLQTPDFEVIEATDLGIVKATISLCKVFDLKEFTYKVDNRKATIRRLRHDKEQKSSSVTKIDSESANGF